MAETTPPAACFYEHTAQSIIPHLAKQMPYSSSLLRRIQHTLAYPSPTAKILATFPPGSTPGSPGPDSDPSTPWLAAQVDLFRGRETQIILFSSLEAECTSLPLIVPVTGSATLSPTDLSRYSGPASAAGPAVANANTNANANSLPHASTSNNDNVPVSESEQGRSSPDYAVSTITASPADLETVRAQLLAFLAFVKAQLLPEYLSSLPDTKSGSGFGSSANSTSAPAATGVTLIPPPDPHAFLFGSLHTGLFALLLRSGKFPRVDAGVKAPVDPGPLPGLRVHRFDNPPYYKYFFTRAVFSPSVAGQTATEMENPLPAGYRYHDRRGRVGVLSSQLDLVQSRTHIPRPRRQLQSLPSVAVYCDSQSSGANSAGEETEQEDEMPIAWAFLGVDGAVATLHVEPEHRGRGLALSLSKEVMRRGMATEGVFGAKKVGLVDTEMRGFVEDWVHAEVAGYNNASRRVMEKIGGKVLTTVVWTVIELLD
ncbi:uncharacterized protein N7496_005092 [Penicillium cataractarum]|uniref:FR47-like domain-containing protein n=1 Tax=Penicillium cataractarum TaxID=2100454 RepID=A0A9W9SJW6_9EURO|nr:uncharacterized protein N7496_005092 [Penicillium cataractarum]KAJ5377683.1 hypothetical protein N7496_005092 [Penicillium cataractarum]